MAVGAGSEVGADAGEGGAALDELDAVPARNPAIRMDRNQREQVHKPARSAAFMRGAAAGGVGSV